MNKVIALLSGFAHLIILSGITSCNNDAKYLDTIESLNTSFENSYDYSIKEIESDLADFENNELNTWGLRALPYYEKAVKIKKCSDTLCKLVDSLKLQLIKAGRGDNSVFSMNPDSKKNTIIANELLVKTGVATYLKKQIDKAVQIILESDTKSNFEYYRKYFIEDKYKDNFCNDSLWTYKKFGIGIPLALAIVNLSKIDYDISMMALILEKEQHRISRPGCNMGFPHNGAFVFPRQQNPVLVGDRYEASILIYCELNDEIGRSVKDINVNGKTLPIIRGVGIYTVDATTPGEKSYHGTVKVKDWDSTEKAFQFDGRYNVVKPSAALDFVNMHFIYSGIDNPVSVSVPFIDKKRINLRLSRGEISGSNGKFSIRVNDPGPLTIYVEDKRNKGMIKVIDSFMYSVKP